MSLGVAGCFSYRLTCTRGVRVAAVQGTQKHHFGITLGDTLVGVGLFSGAVWLSLQIETDPRVCDGPRLCWHCECCFITQSGFSALLLLPPSQLSSGAHLLNGCVAPSPSPPPLCFLCSPCSRRGLAEQHYLCLLQHGHAFTSADSASTVPSNVPGTHGECES